jgi:Na+-driven multidrug efflux pump/anti-sigma regulatory factor (Ser/Thr protein kinase)
MLALLGAKVGQIIGVMIIGQRLEPIALSVMGVVLPMEFMFAAAGALFGVGGTVMCARTIGKGQFEECHRVFTITYLLTLLTAVFFALVLLCFIDPVVRFLGAGPEIFEDTKRYAAILIAGGVFSMSVYPAYNFLRLDGRFGAAVAVFFVMAAVTIVLAVVLLFGLNMGVEAAAIAGVTGAAVSGVGGAVLLFTRSKNFHFTQSIFKKDYRRDVFQIIRDVVVAGSPSAIESLCIFGYVIVLNKLIVRSFGLAALSSFKLIDSINTFALVLIYAVTGPLIQFVGVFGAEKDSQSIRQLLAQVFKWGACFILCYTVLCEFFTPNLAGLFGMGSPDMLVTSAPAIRIFAASLFLALLNTILISVYQAGNRALLANILTVSRLFLWIVIPAPILSGWLGITGIWHSFWMAEFLTLVTAVVLSLFCRRGNAYLSPILLMDREAEMKGVYQSFSVKNTVEHITQSSAGITEFCERNSLSAKLTMVISLSIEEMLVAIRDHSLSNDSNATMNVRVLIEDRIVILRVRNDGQGFNPVDYARNAGEDEEAEVMGIKMILALAEKIDYRNTFGINNTTILLRR